MRHYSLIALSLSLAGLVHAGYVVNTLAGGGPGNGEPATSAVLSIAGFTMDSSGMLYFSQGTRLYKVDASGNIVIVAGKGTTGQSSGDGGLAVNAGIRAAVALAVDRSGNIFFVDGTSVRRIDAGTGIVTTIYQMAATMSDLAADASGNIYVAHRFTSGASGVAVIAPGGAVSIIPGPGGFIAEQVGVDPSTGNIYIGAYTLSGTLATYLVVSGVPTVVHVGHEVTRFDSGGRGYASDSSGSVVLRFSPGFGSSSVVAGSGTAGFSGDGGVSVAAQLRSPGGLAVQPNGDFAVWDSGNFRIRRVAAGIINTVAGNGGSPGDLALGVGGIGLPGADVQLTNLSQSVAADLQGNVYFAAGYRILKIDGATGIVSTVAGGLPYPSNGLESPDGTVATLAFVYPGQVAVDPGGIVYYTVAYGGLRRIVNGRLETVNAANYTSIVFDQSGNLYGVLGQSLRKFPPGSASSTLLTVLSSVPTCLAVDSGNLYFYDGAIRRIPPGGGGVTTVLSLAGVHMMAVDVDGSLLVSDNATIRRVTVSPSVSTAIVAGTGVTGFNGDGLSATATQFWSPWGIAVEANGTILVDDLSNGRIRRLIPANSVLVQTSPNGLQIVVDGVTATAPQTYAWPTGSSHTLDAPTPQSIANGPYSFVSWSDGGAATHQVTAPPIDATYTAVFNTAPPLPSLAISKSHSGNFSQGQTGAQYTVTVSNAVSAGPTAGAVTVTETLPAGLALVSMSGTGWTCPAGGNTCSRSDGLSGGTNYPPITVSVNVAANAPSPLVNQVNVSGGGSATASASDSTIIGAAPPHPADFNGDGHADVIWQDLVSGWAQVWYLGGAQGTTTIGAANLTASNTWRIVGVGDFNGDGHPDVVWQDPVSGAAQVWLLGGSGGNVVTNALVLSTGNSWRIRAIADFNGDGRPDCIWQDQSSGWAQIWFLGGTQGTSVTGAVNLTASNTWRIAGAADFNRDGRIDVLWQDPSSGTTQIWYLGGAQGNVVVDAVTLTGPNTWRIAAVNDFNADGYPDTIWQDPLTGTSQVWYLGGSQGASITGAASMSGANSWRIMGPR